MEFLLTETLEILYSGPLNFGHNGGNQCTTIINVNMFIIEFYLGMAILFFSCSHNESVCHVLVTPTFLSVSLKYTDDRFTVMSSGSVGLCVLKYVLCAMCVNVSYLLIICC